MRGPSVPYWLTWKNAKRVVWFVAFNEVRGIIMTGPAWALLWQRLS